MTPVFENHTVITKDLYTEIIKKTYRKSRRNLIGLVFGLAFCTFAVLYFLWGDFLLGMIMGIGGLALLWIWWFGYQLLAARGYKRQLAINGGQPPRRTSRFYQDHIEVDADNGGHTVWKYGQISRVEQGKYGMALLLKDNVAILLDLAVFTDDTRADFIAFLSEKCPQAKW